MRRGAAFKTVDALFRERLKTVSARAIPLQRNMCATCASMAVDLHAQSCMSLPISMQAPGADQWACSDDRTVSDSEDGARKTSQTDRRDCEAARGTWVPTAHTLPANARITHSHARAYGAVGCSGVHLHDERRCHFAPAPSCADRRIVRCERHRPANAPHWSWSCAIVVSLILSRSTQPCDLCGFAWPVGPEELT